MSFRLGTILISSLMLSNLTKTRYEYNSTKSKTLNKFERLRLDSIKQNRQKFDLRLEYFKLINKLTLEDQIELNLNQSSSIQQEKQEKQETEKSLNEIFDSKLNKDQSKNQKTRHLSKNRHSWDWDGEQVRVNRLPGMKEWGSVDPRDQSPEIETRLV